MVDKVTQHSSRMSFFIHLIFKSNLKGNPARPLFNVDTVQEAIANNIAHIRTDPNFNKALPSKIDYEKLLPFFVLRPHEVFQYTLQLTTQLSKSTIHYPMLPSFKNSVSS